MDAKIVIATAGNTLASALAALKSAGYTVTVAARANDGSVHLLQAENAGCRLLAEDPLLLLGLAKLAEARGSSWAPTDSEVQQLLSLDLAPAQPAAQRDGPASGGSAR